ncbi:WD40-repeat-containing domain protein [Zychaea mexicana]|uniref:WD40-repeat-containing domain protein n=1 Tax=Zychaea mexicana TaxID=64656 RepID=UPI0022FE9962|nr:WD40-repeat-containing domain protein [Zychaea mexicana]KAI9499328.1 WD40-repeat-containing domain protein [Zychaea mexicana]
MERTPLSPSARLNGHNGAVLCAKYAENSILGPDILASGSEDQTCRLWDLRQMRAIKGIQKLNDAVSSVAFGQNAELYLAVGTKVYTYDLRNDGMIISEPVQEYAFSQDEINSIDIHSNGKYLATADDQGEVKVIDLERHKPYKKLVKKHDNICMAVRFRAKKPWEVWSGGLDCRLFQWDFSRGVPVNGYDTNANEASSAQMFNPPFVYSIDTSPTGNWVAAGLGDCSIQVLGEVGGSKKKKKQTCHARLMDAHTNLVNCLCFLPQGQEDGSSFEQLLSGSANGILARWELNEEQIQASDMLAAKSTYQLDNSVARLNWIESCGTEGNAYRIAAAGVGNQTNQGTLNIYSII